MHRRRRLTVFDAVASAPDGRERGPNTVRPGRPYGRASSSEQRGIGDPSGSRPKAPTTSRTLRVRSTGKGWSAWWTERVRPGRAGGGIALSALSERCAVRSERSEREPREGERGGTTREPVRISDRATASRVVGVRRPPITWSFERRRAPFVMTRDAGRRLSNHGEAATQVEGFLHT